MASSVTLDFFKNFLGVSTSTDDLRLQACLDGGSQSANQYCKRRFMQQTDAVYLNGNNTQRIFVQNGPLLSATVWLDYSGRYGDNPNGSFANPPLILGTDYSIPYDGQLGDDCDDSQDTTPVCKASMIQRIGAVWPGRWVRTMGLTGALIPGAGNIKITYTAGWTQDTLPMTVRLAICQIANVILRSAPFGGFLQSESWQGYSYSLGLLAINSYPELGTSRANLNTFRRAF